MADEGAMNSLLAAVAVVAGSRADTDNAASPTPPSSINTNTAAPPPTPNHNPLPATQPSIVPRPPLPSPSSLRVTPRRPVSLTPISLKPVPPTPGPSNPATTEPVFPFSILPPPPPLPPRLPSPPPIPPPRSSAPSNSTPSALTPAPLRTPKTKSVQTQPRSTPLSTNQPKKGARIFSQSEKKVLEANYKINKFPLRVHMNTIAKGMHKSTDKVRTWYNNRRASDRKMGHDVRRNTPATPGSDRIVDATPRASSVRKELEEDDRVEAVVLPPNLVTASPSILKTPRPSERQLTHGHFVGTTTSWIQSASPVTAPSPMKYAASPGAPTPVTPAMHGSSSRFRIQPLRIRHVNLTIGSKTLHGEEPNNPPLDQGLEVKFLFGKKRIVYEWYCGSDYSKSQDTGGPYAKIEMPFASITNLRAKYGPSTTSLCLSFDMDPVLYLQTEQSMDKFKQRAQQRQYRKVSATQFPIAVVKDEHMLHMKTDEAASVLNILLKDHPALLRVFKRETDDTFTTANPSPKTLRVPDLRQQLFTHERMQGWRETPASPRLPPAPTGVLRRKPPSTTPSEIQATDSQHGDASHTGSSSGAQPSRLPTSQPSDGTRRLESLPTRLTWQSPDRCTEDRADSRHVDRDAPRGGCISARETAATPLTTRLNGRDGVAAVEPATVRRELNFGSVAAGSPRRGRGLKRQFSAVEERHEDGGHGERNRVRRRLSDEEDVESDHRTTGRGRDDLMEDIGAHATGTGLERVRDSQQQVRVNANARVARGSADSGRRCGNEEVVEGVKSVAERDRKRDKDRLNEQGKNDRGNAVIRRLPR